MARKPRNPPEGMPRISPYLFYRDLPAALEWLEKAFGLETRMTVPGPDGKPAHAEMTLADGLVMMGPASDERKTKSPQDLPAVNQSLYVYVDDVEAHFARAKASGAKISAELETMFWGDRMYTAHDCEGHHWTFAQCVKVVPPGELKPPGS